MKIITLALLLLFSVTNAYTISKSEWEGDYLYIEKGIAIKERKQVDIYHRIRVWEQNGNLKAHFYSIGFGTYRDLYLNVRVQNDSVDFLFEKYGLVHQYQKYEPNEIVLRIKKERNNLKTIWQKALPTFRSSIRTNKVFFKKVDPRKYQSDDWTRLEFKAMGISFQIPSRFLIDKTPKRAIKLRATGRETTVLVRYLRSSNGFSRQALGLDKASGALILDKGVRVGSSLSFPSANTFERQIKIQSGKRLLILDVLGDSSATDIAADLYNGIEVNGKSILGIAPVIIGSKRVDVASIDSSAEVLKFLNLDQKDAERNVTETLLRNRKNTLVSNWRGKSPYLVEPAFVLRMPGSGLFGGPFVADIKLLKTGLIGDIKFSGNLSKSVRKKLLKSLYEMRFVPTKRKGEYINSIARVTWSGIDVRQVDLVSVE